MRVKSIREVRMCFRCNDSEACVLEEAASVAGISRSGLIRRAALLAATEELVNRRR